MAQAFNVWFRVLKPNVAQPSEAFERGRRRRLSEPRQGRVSVAAVIEYFARAVAGQSNGGFFFWFVESGVALTAIALWIGQRAVAVNPMGTDSKNSHFKIAHYSA